MTSKRPPASCTNWGAICCMVQPINQEACRMYQPPLSLANLRKVPTPCSWVDQRLVRERSIDQLSHEACALYLLLVTVADAQGLSFYYSFKPRPLGRGTLCWGSKGA